ncbi:MAG: M50 family metallopeptidase [Magnetococcales bacterium]|nr:M50 family metallopeptidase [Magnetococcales bacterium]
MHKTSSRTSNVDNYLERNREILSAESSKLLENITANIRNLSNTPAKKTHQYSDDLSNTINSKPRYNQKKYISTESKSYYTFTGETNEATLKKKEEKRVREQRQNETIKQFFVMLCLATCLNLLNSFHSPLAWLNTFFHEMCHVVGLLLTGGDVTLVRIYENANGITMFKNQLQPSLFAIWIGYGGEILFGLLIYRLGLIRDNFRLSVLSLILLAVMVFVTLNGDLPLIQDQTSIRILAVLYGMIAIVPICNYLGLFPNAIRYGVRMIGLFMVAQNIVLPPILPIFGYYYYDALILEHFTHISHLFWMLTWNLWAICAIRWMLSMTRRAAIPQTVQKQRWSSSVPVA